MKFTFKGVKPICVVKSAALVRGESSRLRGLPGVSQEHWVPAGPGVLLNAHQETDQTNSARAEDTQP